MRNTCKNAGKLLLILTILPFTMLFSSCEEISVDLRNELLGEYDFEIKAFLDDGDQLNYIGDENGLYDITGTTQVRKNDQYDDVIDFYDGGVFLFSGERIRKTENSIVFDIPEQEFWLGAIPVTLRGLNYWDIDDQSYHGAYLYADKSVEIAFAAEVMDVSSDLVLLFIAYKHQ